MATWLENTSEAQLLWDEYRYRHEHIWNLVFQLTGAAVVLGTVPYLESSLQQHAPFKYWLLAPPVLAALLIILALSRMSRELRLLHEVKSIHRARQREVYRMDPASGSFDEHVQLYLRVLLSLAVGNLIVGFVYLYL